MSIPRENSTVVQLYSFLVVYIYTYVLLSSKLYCCLPSPIEFNFCLLPCVQFFFPGSIFPNLSQNAKKKGFLPIKYEIFHAVAPHVNESLSSLVVH